MKYHIRWEQSAVEELSSVWLSANPSDRGRITDAAGELDRHLRHDPYADSESRDNNDRIAFIDVLGVQFRVEDEDMLVSVVKIWGIRTKRK